MKDLGDTLSEQQRRTIEIIEGIDDQITQMKSDKNYKNMARTLRKTLINKIAEMGDTLQNIAEGMDEVEIIGERIYVGDEES